MKVLLFLICTSAAFAQTPRPIPSGTTVGNDSILLGTVIPRQYDFYYSSKQAGTYEEISMASYTLEDRVKKNRFRDKTFTEVVLKGLNVRGGFDDYVLVGSGTLTEIRPHGEW